MGTIVDTSKVSSSARNLYGLIMSAELQWMIIRNNSSSLLKGSGQTFSKEANNLRSKNSYRYNGLVRRKTIGVEAAADGKGIILVTRKQSNWRRPGKSMNHTELKSDSRKTLTTIRNTIRKGRYRKDLKMAALRKASALLRSQKPVPVRKQRGAAKKKDN